MPFVTENHFEVVHSPASRQAAQDAALIEVLHHARARQYRFITPTPMTHARVLINRKTDIAGGLRDVFGWNLPFSAPVIGLAIVKAMQRAGILAAEGAGLRSLARIASIDDALYLHSAYPTTSDDSVFFGPDTYRFVRFIRQSLQTLGLSKPARSASCEGRPLRLLDVGSGSGAGGIAAYRALAASKRSSELVMNDINPLALRFTAINAAFAGVPVTLASGDCLSATTGKFDLIVSNPPYMSDPARRAYRHGGAGLGRALSVQIAREALSRLAPGGALLLYTGVAMEGGGRDRFLQDMVPALDSAGCDWSYSEIDPDVFGEELEGPAYANAERIAAVGLIAQRLGASG